MQNVLRSLEAKIKVGMDMHLSLLHCYISSTGYSPGQSTPYNYSSQKHCRPSWTAVISSRRVFVQYKSQLPPTLSRPNTIHRLRNANIGRLEFVQAHAYDNRGEP